MNSYSKFSCKVKSKQSDIYFKCSNLTKKISTLTLMNHSRKSKLISIYYTSSSVLDELRSKANNLHIYTSIALASPLRSLFLLYNPSEFCSRFLNLHRSKMALYVIYLIREAAFWGKQSTYLYIYCLEQEWKD